MSDSATPWTGVRPAPLSTESPGKHTGVGCQPACRGSSPPRAGTFVSGPLHRQAGSSPLAPPGGSSAQLHPEGGTDADLRKGGTFQAEPVPRAEVRNTNARGHQGVCTACIHCGDKSQEIKLGKRWGHTVQWPQATVRFVQGEEHAQLPGSCLCTQGHILECITLQEHPNHGDDALASGVFLGVQVVKNLPAHVGDLRDLGSIPGLGRSPGGAHGSPSSMLAWRIPCTEEPGRLQSMVSKESDTTKVT